MVATSSMRHSGLSQSPTSVLKGKSGSAGAIRLVMAAGLPAGQFYRGQKLEPPLSDMQGLSGIAVAGHMALRVVESAEPGSRAHTAAEAFISQYPNSHIIHPGSLA